jgi:hypothetical protein
MKIYIQRHNEFAGKWIYSGYAHAWAYLDHQVKFINDLQEINENESYKLFITENLLTSNNLKYLENSVATYLYVQPNIFPNHWGKHPNFISCQNEKVIEIINSYKNVYKWSFSRDTSTYFTLWKNVVSMPLAFDNINYLPQKVSNFQYDICFIGSVANNGFNEKIIIMQETLNHFIASGLKCGFSVGQNINHDTENNVFNSSKVALNIHDLYQRTLGLDTNERTFKALGCNGLLVSDEVYQITDLFPNVFQSNDYKKLVDKAKELCNLSISDLNEIKEENKRYIEANHTYIKRAEKFLSFNENFNNHSKLQ